jgi:hypothetical protein
MKGFGKAFLAATAVGVAAIATSGSANAAAYAISSLNITNFNVSGIPPFIATSFTLVGNKSQLGGSVISNGPVGPVAAASLDLPLLCQSVPGGVCAGVLENDLTTPIGNDPGDGQYGRGDSHMLDTIVNEAAGDGLPKTGEFGGIGEARSTGALVTLGADGPDNRMNWNFSPPADDNSDDTVVTFDYDGELIFKLIRDNDGDFAAATSVFRIRVLDLTTGGTVIGDINDAALNLNVTLASGIPEAFDVDASTGGPVHFSPTVTIPDAREGHLFSLDFIFSNTATADAVVEPMTVGMLGLGLLGIGIAARRRKAAA